MFPNYNTKANQINYGKCLPKNKYCECKTLPSPPITITKLIT